MFVCLFGYFTQSNWNLNFNKLQDKFRMTLMMDQLIEIKWMEKKLKKKLFFSRFKFQFISKLMAIFPILIRKNIEFFFAIFFFFIIQTLCVWVFGDFYLISKECVVTRTKKNFFFFLAQNFWIFFWVFFVTDNTHTHTLLSSTSLHHYSWMNER